VVESGDSEKKKVEDLIVKHGIQGNLPEAGITRQRPRKRGRGDQHVGGKPQIRREEITIGGGSGYGAGCSEPAGQIVGQLILAALGNGCWSYYDLSPRPRV